MGNTYKDNKYKKTGKPERIKHRSRLNNPYDGSSRRTQDVHKGAKDYQRKKIDLINDDLYDEDYIDYIDYQDYIDEEE